MKPTREYARLDFRVWALGLALFMVAGTASRAFAQESSIESWPEVDLWFRLNPEWRLSAFVPLTKYHESENLDLNVYLQADYAFGTPHAINRRLMDDNRARQMKGWLVRGGYMRGRSIGDDAGDYAEDALLGELHNRLPVIWGGLVSSRLRMDARWLGEDQDYSYRIRGRVMVEKEITSGPHSFVPYISVEPFWDSRTSNVDRIRGILGTTLSQGGRFAYEANITYQHDKTYATTNLYALNLILHVYFEARHPETNP